MNTYNDKKLTIAKSLIFFLYAALINIEHLTAVFRKIYYHILLAK